jgi:predicted DCC family thiol-disulfide oxidoreductase YuxK
MKKDGCDIVLFDGICNLCNRSVQFIIKHDKERKFRFASLQSEFGKLKIIENQIDAHKFDSIIYFHNHKYYSKSTAVLKIAKHLDGLWPIFFGFIIIPPFIRDWIYDFLSKRRYAWFGKNDTCMVPSPDNKWRFLI